MLNIIVGGACRTLTRNNLLFYLSEEFYTTEQRILNFSICLFPTFGKIKIAGSYEDKITATFQTSAFVCFSFILFYKQCFYLKFHLENFLKPNQFWFQKRDGKNIDWHQKEMLCKMHKMMKQLLAPFTWKQIFLLLKKFSENCNVNIHLLKIVRQSILNVWCFRT